MVSPVFVRPLLAIVITAAIIGVVAVISRNGSRHASQEQPAFQQLPQHIDVALKKARFSEMRDGTVAWRLVAEKVEYDKSGEIARLADIRMDFDRTGSGGAVTVTADNGEYLSGSRLVRLRGKVRVRSGSGASFETGSIEYRAASSRFFTDDRVQFQQQRLKLEATGMEMDVKEQRTRFFSSVDATVSGQ